MKKRADSPLGRWGRFLVHVVSYGVPQVSSQQSHTAKTPNKAKALRTAANRREWQAKDANFIRPFRSIHIQPAVDNPHHPGVRQNTAQNLNVLTEKLPSLGCCFNREHGIYQKTGDHCPFVDISSTSQRQNFSTCLLPTIFSF